MLLVPAGFLVVLLMSFNLVGDALSDALDPREAGSRE
jgi:ABC-type dipeptide/oligopeptide/nickel transport system permease subunit